MNLNRRSFLSGISVGGLLSLGRNRTAHAGTDRAASAAPSGPGKLKKVADVDVYRNPKYYCGPGPSPLVLPDGKILMAFRRSLEPGHFNPEVEMCLLMSVDDGRTWPREPEVFDFGPITNANLTLLRDGTILYATHADVLLTRRIFD